MNKTIWVLLLMGTLIYACTHDPIESELDTRLRANLNAISPTGSYEYFQFPASDDFAAIPNQDPENPLTAEKVALGQLLFHETALATNALYPVSEGNYSCASCHIAAAGFTPGTAQGMADGALGFGAHRVKIASYEDDEVDAQGTRPLSVLNVAYVTNTLWSGLFGAGGCNEGTEDLWHVHPDAEINFEGLQGLEAQNIEGLELHRMEINHYLLDQLGYRALYDASFPEIPMLERYTPRTTSFALSAYLRTLFAQKAPFQKWLAGEETRMTNQEKRGALLFLGKANCIKCHNGPSFNAVAFHAIGTSDLYQNHEAINTNSEDARHLGRAFFSGRLEDENRFKVPQLYNLKDYSHFFHGSSKETLAEVLEFKLKAQSENPNVSNEQLSSFFRPVELTETEKEDLLMFLESALYDSYLERYVPEEVLSGNCIPNNDPFSRQELGCF